MMIKWYAADKNGNWKSFMKKSELDAFLAENPDWYEVMA